jgi:hypothetical protein
MLEAHGKGKTMKRSASCIAAVLSAVCLLLSAGLAAAGVGDLGPVGCDPVDGQAYPENVASISLTEKAPPGAGTVSPKALTGPIRMSIVAGAMRITRIPGRVAVDYTQDGAGTPDVVRLGFTGEGKFDPKHCAALRKLPRSSKKYFRADFGPVTVPAQHDGKTFLVGVRGHFLKSRTRTYHRVYVSFAAAVQGKCRFGKKRLLVRFLDTTNNFRFDDPAMVPERRYKPSLGDVVLIDTGNGAFGGSAVRACYGQPVFVDGVWWNVTISADGTKAAARPAAVQAGRLALPGDNWEVGLTSGGKGFVVCGGTEPAAVPAGDYQLIYYRQFAAPDAKGRRAIVLAGMVEFAQGRPKTVTVTKGQTTRLDVGAPLLAELSAKPSGQSIRLGMARPTTLGGLSVRSITSPGGWIYSRPPRPKLHIRDESGKLVDTVSLEYG